MNDIWKDWSIPIDESKEIFHQVKWNNNDEEKY